MFNTGDSVVHVRRSDCLFLSRMQTKLREKTTFHRSVSSEQTADQMMFGLFCHEGSVKWRTTVSSEASSSFNTDCGLMVIRFTGGLHGVTISWPDR